MKKIQFKGINLHYETFGHSSKTPVLLVHGYLESMEIYHDLVMELKKDFYLMVPDLPGHGFSGTYSETHSMEDMAEALWNVKKACNAGKIHLMGHSMGGYVCLAFMEKYPDSLLSLSLLNSHCFADSEEKKQNRIREIEMIRAGKKELMVNTNIHRIFANDNLETFSYEVERSISIAMKTPDEGIIALLNGMKDRPDRSHLLKDTRIPSYLISGMKDNLISPSMAGEILLLAPGMKHFKLQNSGHMSFIEEKEKVVKIIREIAV